MKKIGFHVKYIGKSQKMQNWICLLSCLICLLMSLKVNKISSTYHVAHLEFRSDSTFERGIARAAQFQT